MIFKLYGSDNTSDVGMFYRFQFCNIVEPGEIVYKSLPVIWVRCYIHGAGDYEWWYE